MSFSNGLGEIGRHRFMSHSRASWSALIYTNFS